MTAAIRTMSAAHAESCSISRRNSGICVLTYSTQASGRQISTHSAAPITINPGEFYEALNRGLAHGVLISWQGSRTFKLQEVAHNHMTVPFGQFPAFVAMNSASYGGAVLPPARRRSRPDQPGVDRSL